MVECNGVEILCMLCSFSYFNFHVLVESCFQACCRGLVFSRFHQQFLRTKSIVKLVHRDFTFKDNGSFVM